MERLMIGIGAVLAVVAVLAIGFVVSLRTQFPPALRAIRRMNKAVWNPRAMETAGQAGATTSVVRHVGRTSGREYSTPVSMYPIDGGFLIPLPYGRTADWTKNVMAAKQAEVVHDGVTYEVEAPAFLARRDAESFLPEGERRVLTTMGVAEVLRVSIPAEAADASDPLDNTRSGSDA